HRRYQSLRAGRHNFRSWFRVLGLVSGLFAFAESESNIPGLVLAKSGWARLRHLDASERQPHFARIAEHNGRWGIDDSYSSTNAAANQPAAGNFTQRSPDMERQHQPGHWLSCLSQRNFGRLL